MYSRTIARIEKLEKASWFSRIGVAAGASVAAVSSWPEAITCCDTKEWTDLRQEMLNQYGVYIHQHHRERLQDWNERIQAIKKLTEPLVERKTAPVIRENALPDIFRTRVRFDVAIFCMEAEYDDICPPGFFTRLGSWYLDGHFPCGWWGLFPEGKLIVY
ncbi:MAG TPA: hypothetical protein VKW08_14525 [Xanthobacteraceae bacterium]|nr:hypothetical protein [Xanthobacteraceae bacterium]